jgi:hypothetical protein
MVVLSESSLWMLLLGQANNPSDSDFFYVVLLITTGLGQTDVADEGQIFFPMLLIGKFLPWRKSPLGSE